MRDLAGIVAELDAQLRGAGTPQRAAAERAYLHSSLSHYGVPVPRIRALVRTACRAHPDLTRAEVRGLAALLWAAPVHERRMAAVELLEDSLDRLTPADLPLVERLVREARTWALVDGLAADVAGGIVARWPQDPRVQQRLRRWAVDTDFWVRRAALLAELRWLRSGGGFERFARHAESMLAEREFFIGKAIGWVMRETAKTRPAEVTEWLVPRAHLASTVTLREATKPLDPAQREAVLTARTARRGQAGCTPAGNRR